VRWQPGALPLAPHDGSTGVWHGFVSGLGAGDCYKYHIESAATGEHLEKADPFATCTELAPRTASIIAAPSAHEWQDDAWMRSRGRRNALDAPISVYELHTGSFARVPEEGDRMLTWRELAPRVIEHVLAAGFTHVQLMPIMEHPFAGSWGYQTTGYFAPTARHGSPDDLRWFVDQLHQAQIGVLLDWVPSHFPLDAHGLARFDGTHLFEHADPRQGFHPDWKSGIFNYERNEVRSFLLSSARYWLDEFHIDGIRVDAVASMLYLDYSRADGEWIPNAHGGRENLAAVELLRTLNRLMYAAQPDIIMIAEESTAWPGVTRPPEHGGLGFGMKWDMGWMHDTLQYISRESIHRAHHQDELSFRQVYAYTENFMLPLSHDEVVHGKGSLLERMPGDHWQRHAGLRLLLAWMWTMPGKQLLFMGGEIAQPREWSHERSVDWHLLDHAPHAGTMQLVHDLNHLMRTRPELHELDHEPSGFSWIDASDAAHSVYSFLRRDRAGNTLVVVANFTPVPREDYDVGVPALGRWRELLSSDDTTYWGGGMRNSAPLDAVGEPLHGQPARISPTLPPLGLIVLGLEERS
jgi:1,4-alpha-glucan branching enzyme